MNVKYSILILTLICAVHADCQTWEEVGGGLRHSSGINDFEIYNGKLHMCGFITVVGAQSVAAGGQPANGVASWDGFQWDTLRNGVLPLSANDLCEYGGELFMGGGFSDIDGVANTRSIGKWDGSVWTEVDGGTLGDIETMEVYNGELYVGGSFNSIGSVSTEDIARWDGVQWSDVGGGVVSSKVHSMAVFNGELYVGGLNIFLAGGTSVSNIAKWDGSQWTDVGGGTDGQVTALVVDTIANVLYAGGGFFTAGGKTVNFVAMWDGTEWWPVDQGLSNGVYDLELYHRELYAVGGFEAVIGSPNDTVNYIARWDGCQWRDLNGGLNQPGNALHVYQDSLHVGGWFTYAGSDSAYYLAKWHTPVDTCGNPSVPEHPSTLWNVTAFPNPASETIMLEFPEKAAFDLMLLVYDLKGVLVDEIKIQAGSSSASINVSNFSSGAYSANLIQGSTLIGVAKFQVR